VPEVHPLLDDNIKRAIESAASFHLGRSWVSRSFTDLNDRASHPCGLLHGLPFSVFAKLWLYVESVEQFKAELTGLGATPTPIGTGVVFLEHDCLLLFEALNELEATPSEQLVHVPHHCVQPDARTNWPIW